MIQMLQVTDTIAIDPAELEEVFLRAWPRRAERQQGLDCGALRFDARRSPSKRCVRGWSGWPAAA